MKVLSYLLAYGVPAILVVGMMVWASEYELIRHRTPRTATYTAPKQLSHPSMSYLEAASICRSVGHECRVYE